MGTHFHFYYWLLTTSKFIKYAKLSETSETDFFLEVWKLAQCLYHMTFKLGTGLLWPDCHIKKKGLKWFNLKIICIDY